MNPCPYSMGDTPIVFLLLAVIAVGGPLFVLWRDNRGTMKADSDD